MTCADDGRASVMKTKPQIAAIPIQQSFKRMPQYTRWHAPAIVDALSGWLLR